MAWPQTNSSLHSKGSWARGAEGKGEARGVGGLTEGSDGRAPNQQQLAAMAVSQYASWQVHHQPCQCICGDGHPHSCCTHPKPLQMTQAVKISFQWEAVN